MQKQKATAANKSRFEKKPLKAWLIVFALFLIFIVICVAVLELYCGFSYYKFRDSLRTNTRCIRLREHPKNVEFLALDQDSQVVKLRTDSMSYILPSVIHEKPDIKLFFLGGSTTECLNVQEEKRFPYLVGRQIEELTNNKINSYNCGVSGNNSIHSLNILINKILPEKPDWVFLMHNVNDIASLRNTGTYWNDNVFRSQIISSGSGLLNYKVRLPKNKFVKTFIPYISLVLLPTAFDGEDLKESIDEWEGSIPPQNLTDSMFINNFRSSIVSFVNICKAWNTRIVILTQANEGIDNEVDSININGIHKKFNNIIREIAADNNIPLIDLDSAIVDSSKYFIDGIHYNNSGSEKVAEIISAEMMKWL